MKPLTSLNMDVRNSSISPPHGFSSIENRKYGTWKLVCLLQILRVQHVLETYNLCHTFAYESLTCSEISLYHFMHCNIFLNSNLNPISPPYRVRINISSWETHIWVCYALDGISVACCLAGFFVLTSVVIVVDNYYNNNYIYIRQVSNQHTQTRMVLHMCNHAIESPLLDTFCLHRWSHSVNQCFGIHMDRFLWDKP